MLVQFLPFAPAGFSPQALGYSLPCAQFDVQVTIYIDRVEAVSARERISFYRVLGHAVSHEIGHVLLRSPAHAASGVMKGIWTRPDWQRAAVDVLPFSESQRDRLRSELLKVRSSEQ